MDTLREYSLSFVGKPYLWGGDDPIHGFDCSGFVQEVLASIGLDPPGDQSAQGLYNYFATHGIINSYGVGALAFYGKDATHVSHVTFCIDNYRCVGADSGGPTTRDLASAIAQNAFVKVRPINYRKDLITTIKPFYPTIIK